MVFLYICALMKKGLLYLFHCSLIYAYIVVNLGLGEHICDDEGSTSIVVLIKKAVCHHKPSEKNRAEPTYKKCDCDCDSENSAHCHHCCHTLVHILDDAQNIPDSTKVSIPDFVQISTLPYSTNDLFALYNTATFEYCTALIVFGPGRGLSASLPLRC